MRSRMDKYYKIDENIPKRTERNQELYRRIYEEAEYTNVEGITTIENTKEINIEKIHEMLQSRENYRRNNNIESPSIKKEVEYPRRNYYEDEEKIYDIRDVLNRAKSSRHEFNDDKPRSTRYNILENINLREKKIDDVNNELEDLINTITSKSLLSQKNDKDLSLDLLDDLKGTNNTIVDKDSSIKSIIKDVIEEEKKQTEELQEEIDKSFFTSSLKLKKSDYEDLYSQDEDTKKSRTFIKVILILLVIVIVVLSGMIVYKLIG